MEEEDTVYHSDFQIDDILQTDSEGGQVRLTLGDSRPVDGETESWSKEAPVLGVDGFYGIPIPADAQGAAQAFSYNDGVRDYVLGTWDNRYIHNVGNMKPGDRAIVTRGPAKIFVKEHNNSVTLYTEGSEGKKESMMISLNGLDEIISLLVGGSVIKMDKDEITFTAGGGKTQVIINAAGVQINGAHFICATQGGCLGVLGPTLAPLPVTNSILLGPAGSMGVAAKSWTVSPA